MTDKPTLSLNKKESNARDRIDERSEQTEKREGGGRIPLGAPTLKLSARDYGGQLEGYVPRWLNDVGGRIQQAMQGGYEPVFTSDQIAAGSAGEDRNSDMGSWVSQIVGGSENGSPMRAYLMKIKKEWYDADQEAKQKQVDAIDEAIQGGHINEKAGDGRYLDTSRTKVTL